MDKMFKPGSKQDYMDLLESIIRTDVSSKAQAMMQMATGKKILNPPKVENDKKCPECSLTTGVKRAENCIKNLQQMGNNLLVANMIISDSWEKRSHDAEDLTMMLSDVTGNLMNLTAEAASIARRIHETSLGLHVTSDFLRYPEELGLLNFSTSGRVSLPHYSHNEASIMCLTWLSTKVNSVMNSHQGRQGPIPEEFKQIYLDFQKAIVDLRDSSEKSTQVFRVLMYCNAEGKLLLKEFIQQLQFHEKNDIITELHVLRRNHERIVYLLERIGWGLADVWTRCSGKHVNFERLLRTSKDRIEPLWVKPDVDIRNGKNLKDRNIKSGREKIQGENNVLPEKRSSKNKKIKGQAVKSKKSARTKRLVFMSELSKVFGFGIQKTRENIRIASGPRSYEKRFSGFSNESSLHLAEKQTIFCTNENLPSRFSEDIYGQGDEGIPKKSNTNALKSNSFEQQLKGVTDKLNNPKSSKVRSSFKKFPGQKGSKRQN